MAAEKEQCERFARKNREEKERGGKGRDYHVRFVVTRREEERGTRAI